jgi:tetratricopeptide (TPR) repeat protein
MKIQLQTSLVLAVSLAMCQFSQRSVAEEAKNDLNAARQSGWQVALLVVDKIEKGDQKDWPGIQAWLKDFRKQTQGLDHKASPEKWPKVDVDALVANNPNFWRAYYEIAPGDPGLGLLHAGMLLGCGEATRAMHVVEFYQLRPGIPKPLADGLAILHNATKLAGKQSNAAMQEGIALFDAGDYAAAVKKYREALQIWPQNGWAYYELGYTLRTQQSVAAGEKPGATNSIRINDPAGKKFSPEVKEALANSRRYTPFQYMAYQGDDRTVIQGFLALAKKAMPAMKALGNTHDRTSVYEAFQQLSEGCQEANIHEMALVTRQILVALRGRYNPSDHPFIATSLRKLAPSPETEAVLTRLAGKEPADGRLAFRQLVPTEDKTYHNPVDGKSYVAPNGWEMYEPQNGVKKEPANGKVKVNLIRLLTPESEWTARASAKDVAEFAKQAEQITKEIMAKSDKPLKLLVEFTCSPSGHEVKIAHQPKDVDEDLMQELYKALSKMKKAPVKEGKVAFQIEFTVKP